MQELIEELIRGIGYGALRLITFGRYEGGARTDRLAEGAMGFALVLTVIFLVYTVGSS